jgi:UDP-GlcNAc:undecaprenyl-phosphate GlcNAc-1-phosphate transferase
VADALPALLIAAAATFAATPLCRALALRLGVVDRPGGRKQHGEPVPMLGGLAVFCGLLALWAYRPGLLTSPLLVAVAGTLLVGVWDDLHDLKTHIKVGWQVLVVAVAVIALGSHLPLITGMPAVDATLSGLFLLGSMNLINFADTYDGLCVLSVAGIASAMAVSAMPVSDLHWAVVGACLGFLPWNQPHRYRIFLGDGGSLMLGLIVGYLALHTPAAAFTTDAAHPPAWVIPLLIMGIPILDGATVTLHRYLAGRPVTVGARDHLSHRLEAVGVPPAIMVPLLAALTAGFASIGPIYAELGSGFGALVLTGAMALWTAGLVLALRCPIYSEGGR